MNDAETDYGIRARENFHPQLPKIYLLKNKPSGSEKRENSFENILYLYSLQVLFGER